MGRKHRLAKDPGLTDRIAAHVEQGNYLETAATAEGLFPQQLFDWLRWGEEGKEPYAAFYVTVTRARAKAELDMVSALRNPPADNHGRSDGSYLRALSWLLERTRREKFGQRLELMAREEAAHDLLTRLRSSLAPATYAEVMEALVGEGGEGSEGGDGSAEPPTTH